MTSKWESWSRGTNSRLPFGVKVKHNLSIAIPFSHVVRRDAFGYLGEDGQSFEFSIFFFSHFIKHSFHRKTHVILEFCICSDYSIRKGVRKVIGSIPTFDWKDDR